jgi:hypothetical protein
MKAARRKPRTRQPRRNRTPKMTTFWTEIRKRTLPKRRAYWSKPTKSRVGSSLELVNESRTVHSMQPR